MPLNIQNISDNKDQDILDKFENLDAETAVIGCLLWDNKSYEKIADFLTDDHFVNPRNKKIFSIIKQLLDKNILVTPITLKNYLENENEDNFDHFKYLNTIKDASPSTQNAYQYAKLLYDLNIKRNLIGIGNNIIQETISNEDDLEGIDLIENAENDLYNLSQTGNADRKHSLFSEALKSAIDVIDQSFKRDGKIAGLATGIKDLDKKLGGLHNSDLIIIAGRPSMGKTAFAFNIAENVARQTDQTVLLFSMEMSSEQVVRRFISSISSIDLQRLMRGQLEENDWEGIDKALSVLSQKSILLDDTPALSPSEIKARARRVKRENKDLAMIVIDYLQLMQVPGRGDNRVAEISEISRSLKALAKELNVPVIALSQLNRAVETRPNKRPILADLRDSGAIEQDADVIAFLYRHSYYDPTDLESKGKAEVNIAKQRNGPTKAVPVAFVENTATFQNLANTERFPPPFYEENEDPFSS